ncbi:MAG TPA: APC family permease, partial [Microbacteriaceae bacterium]|nr:APC family permease [Microbacteriaceae bacterium]
MTTTTPAPPQGKGLATGTLGLFGSTVIGLASTAPVYSLVATLGFVVLAVGPQAPIAFIIAFVPMFFVAFAYQELNRAVPDCGTTFTWATKAFGPRVGWMGGWGVAVAGMVVLANLAQIGGKYLWLLIYPDFASNTLVVTLTGVVFIAVMTWISYRGTEIGEKLQNVLLGLQYLALVVFVIAVIVAISTGQAPEGSTMPSLEWFNPFAFADFSGFIEAVLLALFIYWGWDTCLALNEETKDPQRTPGRAAILSTLILLVTYVGVTVAAMSYAGLGDTGLG